MARYDCFMKQMRIKRADLEQKCRKAALGIRHELDVLHSLPVADPSSTKRIGELDALSLSLEEITGKEACDAAKGIVNRLDALEVQLGHIDAMIDRRISDIYRRAVSGKGLEESAPRELERLLRAWRSRESEAEKLILSLEALIGEVSEGQARCDALLGQLNPDMGKSALIPVREDFLGLDPISLISLHNALSGLLASAIMRVHAESGLPGCCARAALFRIARVPPPQHMSIRFHDKQMIRGVARAEEAKLDALRSGYWKAPELVRRFECGIRAFRGVCAALRENTDAHDIFRIMGEYNLVIRKSGILRHVPELRPQEELKEVPGEGKLLLKYLLLDVFGPLLADFSINILAKNPRSEIAMDKTGILDLIRKNARGIFFKRAEIGHILAGNGLPAALLDLALPMNFALEEQMPELMLPASDGGASLLLNLKGRETLTLEVFRIFPELKTPDSSDN